MKSSLQRLGRALMQPVAVLPLAALLLGLGYFIDPTDWGANSVIAAFLIKSGDAILSNLGIIFAVGVAFGMSKDSHGAAALSGLVAFLTILMLLKPENVALLRSFDPKWAEAGNVDNFAFQGFSKVNNGNAFIGILSGILGATAYNKFHGVKLPDAFAFFSGRRLTPIMSSFMAMVASLILMFIWPAVYQGLVSFGQTLLGMGPVGAGIYGFFNRLLIPTGLHHALNQVFWFDLVGISDINNFLGNVQESITATYHPGMYQAGFFPVMMFGLPAAAIAMFTVAKPERKKYAKSVLLAAALASFLTGVTEPIEFAFMFIAPQLFLVHALLTGISVFLAAQLGWYAGFGFSAGFVDMFLSSRNPMAENWYMLIVLGLVYAAIYFLIFRFAIVKLNLKTLGREDVVEGENTELAADTNYTAMARKILEGLGGKDNVTGSTYCTTRLRLTVKDDSLVNEEIIRQTQIAGIMRPGKGNVQVVVGPQVQFVHDEFEKLL
ncbi:N-acetylglucosamine-specific PTS transporter subunit IIBC [Helcococcus massiliensis]|uniref:N-acetylglucosamine-specific PTS transporter subunit IIBC n=1 Tax=Helcococcus massiliensis TaxID=2040290 RepID=UPI000CDF0A5D|nr:N-acetylglucosamine-specific PTS transporter subunit IIBC [Helcococcus massiliensis]